MRQSFLIVLFSAVMLLSVTPDTVRASGLSQCNLTPEELIRSIPRITGLGDLQSLLDIDALAKRAAQSGKSQQDVDALLNALDKYDPDRALNQLQNIGSLLPKGAVKANAMTGGAIEQVLGNQNVQTLNTALRAVYQDVLRDYNQATAPAEQRQLYEKLEKLNRTIARLPNYTREAAKVGQIVNQKLADSELGNLMNEVQDLLNVAKNPSSLGKDITKIQTLLKGLNLDRLGSLTDQLNDLCGLLPDGPIADKLKQLADKIGKNGLKNAVDTIKDYLRDLLEDTLNDAIDEAGGVVKEKLNDVLEDLKGGNVEGATEALGKMGENGELAGLGEAGKELGEIGKALGEAGAMGANGALNDAVGGIIGGALGQSIPGVNTQTTGQTLGQAALNSAQDVIQKCSTLKNLQPIEIKNEFDRETLMACNEYGFDPPHQIRNGMGTAPISSPVGNSFQGGMCRADSENDCPNSERKYTSPTALPSGYKPHDNPNLNVPQVPWGKVPDAELPCGAVGTLSQVALQSMLGNVTVDVSSSAGLKSTLNSAVMGLLSGIFKYADCQDGRFWGVLNHVVGLVMGKGKYIYDMSNNTFYTPTVSYVTLPPKSTLNFTLSDGAPNAFVLPNGGSFTDAKGSTIELGKGVTARFNPSGMVTTSNGNRYRVDPKKMIRFDPNGMIEIPAATPVPVDPNAMVYPMGPITRLPDWAKQ